MVAGQIEVVGPLNWRDLSCRIREIEVVYSLGLYLIPCVIMSVAKMGTIDRYHTMHKPSNW